MVIGGCGRYHGDRPGMIGEAMGGGKGRGGRVQGGVEEWCGIRRGELRCVEEEDSSQLPCVRKVNV